MKKLSFKKLSGVGQELLLAAKASMDTAYNPYSQFFVGSALLSESGVIITGSNYENASYGLTVCAERAAIARASAEGHKSFIKVAVIGRGAKAPVKDVISPCGMCRQMLLEASHISGHSIEVIMSSTDMKKVVVATIEELLPLGFGPQNLGLDLRRFRRQR
jgi:cytidine deaminase